MPRDDFDQYIREMPEPKLELLDGRLLVGNGAGNMQLLRHLLDGWGAGAAVPMAPAELWRQALHQGFRHLDPPAPAKPLPVWQAWAAQVTYVPALAPAGPMLDGKHRAARERLMMGLFGLAREGTFAQVSGRDVVMRLGEDALTPDVFVVSPREGHLLNQHYLDGPADLVLEVLLPGHETYDRDVKRRRYAAGRVEEYWIVDPHRQTVELLRREGDDYRPRGLDSDGTIRPAAFPGLSFRPALLWEGDDWGHGPNPFTLEAEMPAAPGRPFAMGGVAWGDLPFDPRPGLLPRPLSFEEFASWAPEAKFEMIDGKPWVGGSRGSRNVIGLLSRTEGLATAVTVLHPSQWVAALALAEQERAADAGRRAHWWEVARRAAGELRERFGFGRLVVIGDLVRPLPLNLWSDLTLVAFDLPKEQHTWDASHFLYERYRDEPDINLIKHEHATRSEQEEVAAAGVEI
jgi:Uma2 family endonuclease